MLGADYALYAPLDKPVDFNGIRRFPAIKREMSLGHRLLKATVYCGLNKS